MNNQYSARLRLGGVLRASCTVDAVPVLLMPSCPRAEQGASFASEGKTVKGSRPGVLDRVPEFQVPIFGC